MAITWQDGKDMATRSTHVKTRRRDDIQQARREVWRQAHQTHLRLTWVRPLLRCGAEDPCSAVSYVCMFHRPGDHQAVAAAFPGALAEIATAQLVQWRFPAFALKILHAIRRSARLTAWRTCRQLACASCDDAFAALQGNSMPLLRCRAMLLDGHPPRPRLLAPHVIHCRGTATVPDGGQVSVCSE
jgi:hypothetical protein